MTTDPPPGDTRHPGADYLEALFELEEEGFPLVQAELGRWMGVSRASVSEHVKRLIADGPSPRRAERSGSPTPAATPPSASCGVTDSPSTC
jgi:DNA-binding MarR family transcriptional regulator